MASMNEAVVVDAVRSPIGKSGWKGMEKNGQLCQASAQDLMASVLRELIERVKAKSDKFDPVEIEEVIIGCLSQVGEQGLNIARVVSLLAGIPKEASGCTVNQYCNAGLKAINIAAQAIMLGNGDTIVCGGVELMSHYSMGSDLKVALDAKYPVRLSPGMGSTGMTVPQGVCAEMIADQYNLSRDDMDRFGMWSHQKATKALRDGRFDDHVVPFEFEHAGEKKLVDKDETIRPAALDDPESFLQSMRKLKPAFKPDGAVTAGNSSQIVDGAAAVILMSADKAERLGLDPLCKITGMAVSGGEPVPMLLAPIPASKKAMDRAGKTIDDMDVIEPNEAFASPCLAFCKELGYDFDDPRQNPTGGAIALGHPIGASGVVYFGEMAHHLKRNDGKAGLQMMCGGGGVGIATVVEAV